MLHEDEIGQDEPNEERAEEQYSRGALISVGLFMLAIGLFFGWMVGRADQPTTVVNAPVPTAPAADNPETATLNTQTDAASIAAPIPTPVSIQPETQTTLGDPNAPVTIVEFSDYQCPFCARHSQETFPRLKEEYIDTGRVFYVFKDFPLTGIHPTAPRVHEAGQCVYELAGEDAYWQAHDIFFNTQDIWGDLPNQQEQDDVLVRLLGDVNVEEEELRSCLTSGRYVDDVTQDVQEGFALGLSATPSFFINGYPLVGALPYEVFVEAITLAEDGRLGEVMAENQAQQQAQVPTPPPDFVEVPLGDAPAKGDPNAPITIVEYSDYQCPFCLRHFRETMPQLEPYIEAGQVYYVFKDFPIESIHPQAQKVHESAYCGREQGGESLYWQIHDVMFANQEIWSAPFPPNHIPVIEQLVADSGLEVDMEAFQTCLNSDRYYEIVQANLAEGIGFGVSGTPTFFINGRRLVGAQPFSIFEQAIETLLTQQ